MIFNGTKKNVYLFQVKDCKKNDLAHDLHILPFQFWLHQWRKTGIR